ncbi:MAG: alkaline phosphatase family protein [Flavobacteriia bacterium]|nr:alkaline phosphatase family protein [Flavobacteriia bacterium]
MKRTKLLVVGWDAADWSVLNPLLSQGKMPALASLISKGFRGKLASLQPMLSPLLWTSIATGYRAHDHGILNFVEPDGRGGVRAVRGSSRKKLAFWEVLKDEGIRSNVIGWWPSHPAEDSGAVMVSNFFNHSPDDALHKLDSETIFPRSLADQYADLRVHVTEMTSRILAPFFPDAEELHGSDGVLSAVAKIVAQTTSTHAAATEAMETMEWDITAVYYDAIDHFKHLAMKYHPPKAEDVSEEDFQKYHGVVEAGYRFHDMMLDRLLTLAGEECHVLLLSDHGFAHEEERYRRIPDLPGGPAQEHHPYGVLVGAGPSWRNQVVYGHSLLDICPAILHLFEKPASSDMPGRTPLSWWKSTEIIERVSRANREAANIDAADESMLEDLVQLGYVKLPEDRAEALKLVKADTRYHEITSLLDAGHVETAARKSELLCHDFPDDPRFAYQKLGIQWMLRTNDIDSELSKVKQKFPSPAMEYFQGMHALQSGFYSSAIEHFEKLTSSVDLSPGVLQSVGKALVQAKRIDEAVEWLTPIHDTYTRWPESSLLLAQIEYDRNHLERALDFALEAIRRRYFTPEAHLLVARIARQLGELEAAEAGYQVYAQLAPQDLPILNEWVNLLRALDKNVEANNLEARLRKVPLTVVVSGMPRSGTSMMMQMLNAGGFDIYSDGFRTPDSHNPKGYFEAEKATQLHIDNRWLMETSGKVVKVVTPQLEFLPGNRQYRIIWMKRPTSEVVVSQELMMGKSKEDIQKYFPFAKALKLEQTESEMLRKMEMQGNVTICTIDYHDCIQNPKAIAVRIASFLSDIEGDEADISKMSEVVDPQLYRSHF